MNKRAKKRLKEAVQKQVQELTKSKPEQSFSPPANPYSKSPSEQRGFTAKPGKKRG